MVNETPMYNIVEVDCNTGLADYFVDLQTDGNNVVSTAGTVIDNGGGSFTVDIYPPRGECIYYYFKYKYGMR